MGEIWIKIDLSNGESYIGSVSGTYDITDEDDFMLFLEEQAYMGLKLNNVHLCQKDENGKLKLTPLDAGDSIYKGSLIIMNIDNILTIKFLKEDSDIVKQLRKKIQREQKPLKDAKNVLNFRLTKKEYV